MSKTLRIISFSVPSMLPGEVNIGMVGSVSSLSDPIVIKESHIELVAGPAYIGSPLVTRKIFFQEKGKSPKEESKFQTEVVIAGKCWDIYLAIDDYNK